MAKDVIEFCFSVPNFILSISEEPLTDLFMESNEFFKLVLLLFFVDSSIMGEVSLYGEGTGEMFDVLLLGILLGITVSGPDSPIIARVGELTIPPYSNMGITLFCLVVMWFITSLVDLRTLFPLSNTLTAGEFSSVD